MLMAACCYEDTRTEKQMLAPHSSSLVAGKWEEAGMCFGDTRLEGQVGSTGYLFHLGTNRIEVEGGLWLTRECGALAGKQASPLQGVSSKRFCELEEN